MILSYSLDVGPLPLDILFYFILCIHILILILMLARCRSKLRQLLRKRWRSLDKFCTSIRFVNSNLKHTQKFSDFNVKPMRTISAKTNKTPEITPKSSHFPLKSIFICYFKKGCTIFRPEHVIFL
jgi:hypothetical protein